MFALTKILTSRLIQDIMVVDKKLFFVVCKFTTVRIDCHFHSFVTSKVGAQQRTTLEVVDTHPLYCHYIRGNSSVYIRCDLMSKTHDYMYFFVSAPTVLLKEHFICENTFFVF